TPFPRKQSSDHGTESKPNTETRAKQAHRLRPLLWRGSIGDKALRDAERAAKKAVHDTDRNREPQHRRKRECNISDGRKTGCKCEDFPAAPLVRLAAPVDFSKHIAEAVGGKQERNFESPRPEQLAVKW